ncbi:cupin domain-containing protein [Congregibacter sp.]|uniref:cupin domain-containing protein n=1 Tax=Congregibacter sp. TaxID=2744308 RepID=UPI003F6A7E77
MLRYRLQLDVTEFLAQYWQRKHLFVPGGFENFEVPADGDELAGLAMESGLDSRIVVHEGYSWHQERGPFTTNSYDRPGSWTLLVHGVDQHWDDAAELLHAVRFLPTWRLDDVMMSYATDGGSAGPHYDNYDVFIIQGAGQRLWQIGGLCNGESPLLQDTDLRLLADFEVHSEYLMNTGDVLYVPPGIAHYGTSVGESTSFSIGFRAPRQSDLLARWADNRLTDLEDDLLFQDPAREAAKHAGEITTEDLNLARAQLLSVFDNDDPRWFGEAITNSAAGSDPAPDPATELNLEEQGTWVARTPESRIAWHARNDELLVFAHGCTHDAPVALQKTLEALCGNEDVLLEETLNAHDAARGLLLWLYTEGAIFFYD